MTKRFLYGRMLLAVVFVLSLLLTPQTSHAATGKVIFVNLSDTTAWIARYTYQPYRSSASAGQYNMGSVQQEGWWFNGWWSIEPGKAQTFSVDNQGYFYIENSRGQLTWSNKSKSTGYVRNPDRFSTFVAKDQWTAQTNQLAQQGYRRVDFQEFTPGIYRLSGSTYRAESQQFSFNVSSRSPKFDSVDFPVPGQVYHYSVSYSSWRAEGADWTNLGNRMRLSVYVSGAQKRPTGPREPGYYKGTVTVYYTVRN